MREDKLARREEELAELDKRVHRKESELAAYVAQLQGELERRDAEWASRVAPVTASET